MKTVKAFDKKTGTTYIYEILENKWNPEKKRGECVRRCIGKLDPLTGEVVPTGGRGRKKKNPTPAAESSVPEVRNDPDYKEMYEQLLDQLHQKDTVIKQQAKEIERLKSSWSASLAKISKAVGEASANCVE